jgi:hypothetical protein
MHSGCSTFGRWTELFTMIAIAVDGNL